MSHAIPKPKAPVNRQPGNEVSNPISIIPEVKVEELEGWLNDLYDVNKITSEMIKDMWESFSYKGFNRDDTLKQLQKIVQDKRIIYELIVVAALRGPQAAAKMKLSNGKTPMEMGIQGSGGQGTKKLTLNKITASTADIAAWFLKKMNAPKRIVSDLPGWLQFPSAGSIIMPDNYRALHIDFSKRFSALIGGVFNEGIYTSMVNNSYLNPKLNLFPVQV